MFSNISSLTVLSAVLLSLGTPALAGDERDPEKKGRRPVAERVDDDYRAFASRANPGTPKIDGRLDEEAWEQTLPISDFIQRNPQEGEPATERTVVRVLYDDAALYVGVRAYDSEPDKIVGRLTRRDEYSESDWVIVSIDSYYDRRTAFEFRANPAGVERDMYRFDDTRADDSWDAVWDVGTSIDEEGWTAEFRIPYSQLRFAQGPEQIWGFNVTRIIQRKNEEAQWKPIAKEASGWVSEYGDLEGIQGIKPPRRLEMLPYLAGSQAFTQAQEGNPFETGTEFDGNAGFDLKYGLTNSLTLDLSVNPDFGEVEADPSVVNLGVFETFFAEKRPFFIEGSNIYDFSLRSGNGGAEKLFHSRRIGRRPRGSPDEQGGFVDVPNKTPIIAAAKLTGKTANGWSLGFMDAVTAEARATVIDSVAIEHKENVEPVTNYAALRVQRDFREGKSALGFMGTAVNREVPVTLDFLRGSAYSGGIDARHRFWSGNWELQGKLIGSYVSGSEESIEETQLSSARYFQRPDADHLDFDPTRTELFGSAGGIGFSKIGGGHWRGNVNVEWVSPGFEVNDLGFQREADVIRNNLWIAYREFNPGKIFRNYNLNYNLYNRLTFGGERTTTGMNVNGNFTLLNYWGGWAGIERWLGSLAPRFLRGGPAFASPAGWSGWYGVNSDSRKAVSFEAGGWWFSDDEESNGGGVWAGVAFQPAANVRLRLSPEYSWNHDDWQYITTEFALDSDRYVVSVLDQNTISLTTRLDWTFRPNLSLQLYAQPFVSAGEYEGFREVTSPRADVYDDRFTAYGSDRLSFEASEDPSEAGTYLVDQDADGTTDFSFGDPNFNFRDFNSTIVLRWEYMSGSTMFLVWSQAKSDFDPTGEFRPINDFGDLFAADGESIFRFKINYYLNP